MRFRDRTGATADALPDPGEHVQEHEHEQERLDQGPHDELAKVLAQHDEIAQDQARRAVRLAAKVERVGSREIGACWRAGTATAVVSSFAQLLTGEVDEYGFERRLGDGQVEHIETAALGRVTTRGTIRSAPVMCSSTPPSISRIRVMPSSSPEMCWRGLPDPRSTLR